MRSSTLIRFSGGKSEFVSNNFRTDGGNWWSRMTELDVATTSLRKLPGLEQKLSTPWLGRWVRRSSISDGTREQLHVSCFRCPVDMDDFEVRRFWPGIGAALVTTRKRTKVPVILQNGTISDAV